MTAPTLRTTRLILRALTPQDAPVIAAALNNFEISKWLSVVPYPYTEADAAWFIEENQQGRLRAWMIWHGEVFAGVVGLDQELGYWLAQDAWGKGYATEAASAVIAHHFGATDANLIRSSHFAENAASRNVLLKLGFVDTGPHVIHCKSRGAEVQGVKVALTRARWESLQNE